MSKRIMLTLLPIGLLLVACDGPGPDPVGPEADPPRPDIVQLDLDGDSDLEGPLSDICGTVEDPAGGLPGTQIASPCDGAHNTPPAAAEPLTASFFFLEPIVQSPSGIGTNLSGQADDLTVRIFPYPDRAACLALGGTASQCDVKELQVTEDATAGEYNASWKTAKKGGSPNVVPAESYWQIVVLYDRDGDADMDGDPFEPTEDLGSRIVIQTDSPDASDKGSWAYTAQWGSNTEINFVLATNDEGCFGTARDLDDGQQDGEVECVADLDQGVTMVVNTDEGGVVLEIDPQDGLGTRTVRGELCELAGGNTEIESDIPVLGTCTNWTFDPPLTEEERDAFQGSAIYVCENLSATVPDIGSYAVHAQDGQGTLALVPVGAGAACQAEGLVASADLPFGLDGLWRKLASLVAPRSLVATSTAVIHGDPGGSLDGVGVGTDYQLAKPTVVDIDDPQSSPLTQVLPVNGSTTLTLVLEDETGAAVSGATMFFYSDDVSTVECVPGDPNCTDVDETTTTLPVPAGGTVVEVVSDAGGLVSALWTVQDQDATASALGCWVAVPGSDTPADGGFAGDARGLCDRDPADSDGTGDINDPANYPDGYANGPVIDVDDPFMPPPGFGTAVHANDLDVEFTAAICTSPTVDGLKNEGVWENGCIPGSQTASFQVKLSGSPNDQPFADVKWFVGPSNVPGDNGADRIYFSIELPLDSEPSKTAALIEFDAGDGITGVDEPNEFDDQLEVRKESNVEFPGEAFDRYLTASCAGSSSTSACNSLDGDDGTGGQTAEGAVRYNLDADGNFLFYEFSQLLNGDARDIRLDPSDPAFVGAGVIFQIGVGNVKQGGTIFPEPLSGGQKVYQPLNLP